MAIATCQPIHGWWLPTEVVVVRPATVVPRACHYYSVPAELVRKIMGFTEEQWPSTANGFNSYANYAYLVEAYADCGDDGHTDMFRIGYHLLTAEDFDLYKKYKTDCNDGLRVEEVHIDCGE